MTDAYTPLDDNGLVTISMTRAQRRLMRNTLSGYVQEQIADEPSHPEYRKFHREHMKLLKSIVNVLFDEPEYKAFCDLPLDKPHVHLPV